MENFGQFLTELRKERKLTQQQVADALNVSNKTVSKWECNNGIPEIESLLDLAKLYNMTVDELLNQRKNTHQNYNEEYFHDLIENEYSRKNIISISLLVFGLLAFFAIYWGIYQLSSRLVPSLFIYLGFALLSFAIILICLTKYNKYNKEKNDKLIQWFITFITTSVFIIPCINYKITVDINSELFTFLSKLSIPIFENMNNLNSVTLLTSIGFDSYILIFPITLLLATLVYKVLTFIKLKYFNKPILSSAIKHMLVVVSILIISTVSCIIYINNLESTKKFTKDEYIQFKSNYSEVYKGFEKFYPELEPFDNNPSSSDFAFLDTMISERKSCKDFCGIKEFKDSSNTVTYRASSEIILKRLNTSILVLDVLSVLALLSFLLHKNINKLVNRNHI